MAISKRKYTNEKIILVDPNDKKIGALEKIITHEYGLLHRAFSVVLFRKRHGKLETLLHQRNKKKYHCGGLWTNACCSHPHLGESIMSAAIKRLKQEMGITVKLKNAGKFHYIAPFKNGLTENEIDHVLIGFYEEDRIPYNKKEVAGYQWLSVTLLKKDLLRHPKKYTPWLAKALHIALGGLKKIYVKK